MRRQRARGDYYSRALPLSMTDLSVSTDASRPCRQPMFTTGPGVGIARTLKPVWRDYRWRLPKRPRRRLARSLIQKNSDGSSAAASTSATIIGTNPSPRRCELGRARSDGQGSSSQAERSRLGCPNNRHRTTYGTAAAEAADQGVQATTHALQGDPADELLAFAEKNSAAILVVGNKGMHSGEREWIGNVPDKISHKGTCSVLIISTADAGTGESDGEVISGVAAGDAG